MRSGIWSFIILTLTTMNIGANSRTILVFEDSTRTLAEVRGEIEGGTAYLPVPFFQHSLHLERKDLAPDLVGLCREDLCILLPLRKHDGQEYVSALGLIEALDGAYLWDETAEQLFLDLRSQSEKPVSEDPVDFSLPDLKGRLVQLSDFRGKKVSVFAWASW